MIIMLILEFRHDQLLKPSGYVERKTYWLNAPDVSNCCLFFYFYATAKMFVRAYCKITGTYFCKGVMIAKIKLANMKIFKGFSIATLP
jgi:hypothetical protein